MAKPAIIKHLLLLLFISVLAYFPIFMNLAKYPIRLWDEATYANNAIDLYNGGSLVVPEHMGTPDAYNTKPPLVTGLQALSMHFFGIGELAIRLPSAIFGFLTILLVYLFGVRILQSSATGLLTAIILISARGFIGNHVVRTGDPDATLVFWLILGLFTFIDLVIKKPRNPVPHYVVLAIAITAGFYTKGIAGFFFMPAMVMIAFMSGQYRSLHDKRLYRMLMMSFALCVAYYFIRNIMDPGYIKRVWESEFLRYYKNVMDWHIQPFDFYYRNMIHSRFMQLIHLVPFTLVCLLYLNTEKRRWFIYLAISAVWYFLLISYPAIKLEWYDAPLFPVLALIIAFSFVETGKFIIGKIKPTLETGRVEIALGIIGLFLLYQPYRKILDATKFPETWMYDLELDGAYLKHLHAKYPEITAITVFKREKAEELYDQVLFYKRAFEQQDNMTVRITENNDFNKGELVIACDTAEQLLVAGQYELREIDKWNGALFAEILDKKEITTSDSEVKK